MALFVITWTDRPGGLPVRMAMREAHLAYVAEQGCVRLGGPFLDADGGMGGSLLVVECEDLAAANVFHEGDPYKRAGLFERSEVRPWRATVGGLA